ncbi:RHS repeat-associated core domain-containing protein [Lentzea aerocolonigenes]|uniref:RHS repeat-associated core domain-containing protein n=1 Tax=Lentzea aerocolonigenes TaxID=68170 RepID=UPI0006983C76|nr:RHS repeat-associated core domain-containing protein [Lentzea aerocolonigenes]
MKLKRALVRGLAVCLALSAVTATVEQQAIAAGSPSVNAPDVKSVAVSNGSLSSRGPDEATTRALKGDQPAASTNPGGGSFAATPFSASASWEVSKQSGDFSWSYPLRVPPSPGGFTPSLGLTYRSSAVDGLTSATNNQPSWIGDGWDLSAGYIDRAYGACATDTEGGTTPPKTGDLCWRSDNATASFGSTGGMLIKDDATGVWRLKSDDRSRVEKIVASGNGDKFSEAWKITTVDGTQYFFGTRPGSKSTWTVPVFGDDAGEPCHESTFDASSCDRAWRWMLDKAVDPRGNVILYNYETETNKYGKNLKDTAVPYVRAGSLKSIEYGLRDDVNAPAAGHVEFALADRCVKESNCSFGTKENWPDAAVSENCDTATCKDKHSPTFWSTKRLSTITTQVRSGDGYQNVDSWALQHEFPKTDDVYQAALWLKSIKHTGLVGGEASLPEVSFEGTAKPNRVDAPTGIGPLNRYRVTGVISEAGGVTQVKYAAPDCVPGTSMPASPQSNTLRCYPSKWTPTNGAEREDYFHKYVVESITSSDRIAASAEQVVRYEYLDGAGWRYSRSEFSKDDKKTYDEFRGYQRVRIRAGKETDIGGPVTMTEDRFYRGMHGDKLPNNGTRTAKVTDSEGVEREDSDWLQGIKFETQSHDGTGEIVLAKTISVPTWSGPTATRGAYKAYWVGSGSSAAYTALRAGGWRVVKVENTYDDHGQVTQTNDLGDLGVATDDRCTRTTYAQNVDRWMWSYPAQSEAVSVQCGANAAYPDDVLVGSRVAYDGRQPGEAPVSGTATKQEVLSARPASGAVFETVSTSTFDSYGRPLTVADALGNTARTEYSPSTGGPLTRTTVTDAAGHVSTADFEPAWGLQTKAVDANENVTEATFDPLGRTTQVWHPNRPREDFGDRPSATFSYDVQRDAPTSVTSTEVGPNGGYLAKTTVYDGQYRVRQVQTPTDGGRLVADTKYDGQGRVVRATQPFFNSGQVDKNLLVFSESEVPGLTRSEFDGSGRLKHSIFQGGGQEKWRSTLDYGGDRTDLTPPQGGTPTTTITDARGLVTELWQYRGAVPSGDHETTRYGYTRSGLLASVADAAGNSWRWSYDLRGRRTRSEDVDKGTTTTTYDAASRVASITDARGTTLTYAYDALGRNTSMKSGDTVLQQSEYDTADYGKGLLASATRYVNGQAYVSRVKAYTSLNQPMATETEIPAVEGPLKGIYKTSYTYKPNGSVANEKFGAVTTAGIAEETVVHEYDDFGRQVKASGGLSGAGTDTLVNNTLYTRLGELYRLELGAVGKRTWMSYYYEDNTRRMNRYIVDAEVASPMQSDVTYTYDAVGNVLSTTDAPLGQVADRQCFRYDHLRRLTNAWTPASACAADPVVGNLAGPAPYWHSYGYDVVGNRTTEVQHAASGDLTRTYNYPAAGAPRPHAVGSVTTAGPGVNHVAEFTYDETGNTRTRKVSGANQTLDWDAEGRVVKVTDGAKVSEFLYGADGTRLIRRSTDATTLYVGAQEVRLAKGSTVPTVTRYYTHNGKTVAMREGKSKLTWLAGDHQGTTQLSVDKTTMQVQRKRQLPFGGERGGPSAIPGERGFVGGINDTDAGLVHIGARQYDAALGKFLSADPVMSADDPQQWNAYAYSNNSPITFSDPTGEHYCDSHVCRGDPGYVDRCANCTKDSELGGGDKATYDNGTTAMTGVRGEQYINGIVYPKLDKAPSAHAVAKKIDKQLKNYRRDQPTYYPPEEDLVNRILAMCDSDREFCGDLFDWAYGAQLRGYTENESVMSSDAGGIDRVELGRRWGIGKYATKASPESFMPGFNGKRDTRNPNGHTCNCFPAGTSVSTENGAKPIEQIAVGDRVWARNLITGKSELRKVVGLFNKQASTMLTILAGGVQVQVTPQHPFWVPGKGWVNAGQLKPGDRLTSLAGADVEIRSITSSSVGATVYNFEVEGLNNYYISESQLLVHNCAARKKSDNDDGYRTPRGNQRQNRQAADAIRTAEREIGRRLTDDEKRWVHDEITGQGYDYHDIVDITVAQFRRR